jgi:hypothetical protein
MCYPDELPIMVTVTQVNSPSNYSASVINVLTPSMLGSVC